MKKLLCFILLFLLAAQPALADLTLPDRVETIAAEAFMGDVSLPDSVTLPGNVVSIGDRAFAYSSVKTVYIPPKTERFGEDIFLGCEGIAIAGIAGSPANVYADDNDIPFLAHDADGSGCVFTVQDDGTALLSGYNGEAAYLTIPAQDGQGHPVTAIGAQVFYGNGTLISVTIPEGVTTIEAWAFGLCTELRRVSLPYGLTAIGECAFYGCGKLTLE